MAARSCSATGALPSPLTVRPGSRAVHRVSLHPPARRGRLSHCCASRLPPLSKPSLPLVSVLRYLCPGSTNVKRFPCDTAEPTGSGCHVRGRTRTAMPTLSSARCRPRTCPGLPAHARTSFAQHGTVEQGTIAGALGRRIDACSTRIAEAAAVFPDSPTCFQISKFYSLLYL